MLVGYCRVSRTDDRQATDLQQGVPRIMENLYSLQDCLMNN